MKFKERTDDTVRFDASAEDKQDLLRLIDASIEDLERNRIEVLLHTGADESVLNRMRDVISESADNNDPIEMPGSLFASLTSVASTWKFNGFDLTELDEQQDWGVSQATVEALVEMRTEAFET